MADLILDSLEIENFRAFRHLKIERLGRVNLITGKNNVGKSCLLEGVWIYARRGNVDILRESLQVRSEQYSFALDKSSVEDQIRTLGNLFHGREDARKEPQQFRIGPLTLQHKTLAVSVAWRTSMVETTEQGIQRLLPNSVDAGLPTSPPYLVVKYGGSTIATNIFTPTSGPFSLSSSIALDYDGIFIPTYGIGQNKLSSLWDDVSLTQLENEVVEALQIIAPEVERLGMRSMQESSVRFSFAKLTNDPTPVPLRSMGEGMNRLFGIALALVNSKNGMLLVDEVETGLHYSVLPQVWKLIFEVANRLNVQVFATTHSWDCIVAFQDAASDNQEIEGRLIRLTDKNGNIVSDVFTEEQLEIVVDNAIEVR